MKKQIDFKLVTYFSIIMFLYIVGIEYGFVGMLMGSLAFGICIFYIILNRPDKAFLHFILNLTMSIEATLFATGERTGRITYSFLILPIITICGVIAVNFFIFLRAVCRENKIKAQLQTKSKTVKLLFRICIYILAVGITILIITWLVNDNGISGQGWYLKSIFSEMFRMLMIVLTIINCIILLDRYPKLYDELSRWLIAMLCSLSPVGLLTIALNINGYRMGQTNILILPLFSFFGIGLFAFVKFAANYKQKISIILFASVLFIIMIIRPTPLGGKWFIVVATTMALILYSYVDSKKGPLIMLGVILCFVIVINTDIVEIIFKDNPYMLRKYNEFLSIFKFATDLSQSSGSVAFRVDEIQNIFIELSKNPFYFLFGKGIVGTTLHHTNNFSWSIVGTFSEVQANANIFFQMHESFAVILLKYGLIGLTTLIYILIQLIKRTKNNPWAIIGFFWLLFFFGVYNSMLFGAVCIVLAFFEAPTNKYKTIIISQK